MGCADGSLTLGTANQEGPWSADGIRNTLRSCHCRATERDTRFQDPRRLLKKQIPPEERPEPPQVPPKDRPTLAQVPPKDRPPEPRACHRKGNVGGAETDREIDALVYQLYGLTDEEIQIVEHANDPSG